MLSKLDNGVLFVSIEKNNLYRFQCLLCKTLLKYPKQAECGCRFCSNCLDKYLDKVDIHCPNCVGMTIIKDKVIKDKAVEKEISKLHFNCPNPGCTIVIELGKLQYHIDECLYRSNLNEKSMKINDKSHEYSIINNVLKMESSQNLKKQESSLLYRCNKNQTNLTSNPLIDIKALKQKTEIPEINGNIIDILEINPCEINWLIPNIREKILISQINDQYNVQSRPFYIFHRGYKMRFKLFPNGNGRQENNFLSIYCVLMKGDFDDFQIWPFKMKIIISCFNKYDNNVSINILPNNNEICYGRPSDKDNIGFGEPSFIHTSVLLNDDDFIIEGGLKLTFLFID